MLNKVIFKPMNHISDMKDKLEAISISGQMHSLVLVDKTEAIEERHFME